MVRLHLHRPTPDRSLKTKIRASTHRASQQDLAEVLIRLGQIMHGWANYFRYAIAKNTFSTLDSFVWWFDHAQYSLPHRLVGQMVRVRRHGEQIVITHVGDAGAVEVARHQITTSGDRRVDDTDFPPAQAGAGPHAATNDQQRGRVPGPGRDGAALWLTEAVVTGVTPVETLPERPVATPSGRQIR